MLSLYHIHRAFPKLALFHQSQALSAHQRGPSYPTKVVYDLLNQYLVFLPCKFGPNITPEDVNSSAINCAYLLLYLKACLLIFLTYKLTSSSSVVLDYYASC